MLLALCYALLAKLSLANFSLYNGNVSLIWPSSGLALASLIIGGKKYWPGLFIGALAAGIMVDNSFLLSAFIALGNTLEPLLGYWLFSNYTRSHDPLQSPLDYLKLVIIGATSACASALIGVSSLLVAGTIPQTVIMSVFLNWWQGDTLGIILITPLILVWQVWPRHWFKPNRWIEIVACFGLLILVEQIIFHNWFHDKLSAFAVGYWAFLFVSWAAISFGRHGVTLAIAITGTEALLGVAHHEGFFAHDFEQTHLLNFWFYITTLTLLGMNLALAIRKQQHSIDELKTAITERKQSEQTYQILFKTVRQGIVYQNAEGEIISANPAAERILGLSLDQLQGISSTDPYWNTIHPDGSPFLGETHPTMLAIKTGKPIEGVVMGIINPHAERTVWIRINAMPIFKTNSDQVDYAYAAFEDITERRQWENALMESEQRFRNIANAAPLLIWIAGTDKLCTWFSEGWLNFTGRLLEQEQGNGWTTGVHPDDFQYCLDYYIKHFDQRLPFNMEYRLKHHSGEYRWIHDSGMPRFDGNGEFLGYIGFCLDVSEFRKIQAELVKSQQMLEEAQHIAHIGSWDWDIANRVVSWSDEAAEIYVPDNKQITPSFETFMQSVHPEDRDKIKTALAATLDNDTPYNIEHRLVSIAKGIRIAHAQGKVYRDLDGKAIRMVGTVHDITDRFNAEEDARSSQEQLQAMTAAVPGVVYQFLLTPAGEWQFIYLSKGIEALYEITAEAAYQDRNAITECILPDFRDAHLESVKQSALNLSTWEYEYLIKTPSGSVKWVQVRATPKQQADGSVLWNGILTDITEQKKIEEALRLSASVFEHALESIIITDQNCNIIDVNHAFIKGTGYSRAEVLGKNPRLLQSGHQKKDFYQTMWQTIKESDHWSGELWNHTKLGEAYAELLAISIVKNERGEITHYVGVSTNITHLKNHQQQLENIAHHDALTGLPNRRLLADRMQQAIAQARRNQLLIAVCYLDLDGFKPINDSLGHDTGDLVLVEIAKRIGETIRAGDTVARLGGDEFVILLLGLDKLEEYMSMLDRLLLAISKPMRINNTQIPIGASIGVSIFPNNAEDSDILLRQADQAMYLAKHAGKNRYYLCKE